MATAGIGVLAITERLLLLVAGWLSLLWAVRCCRGICWLKRPERRRSKCERKIKTWVSLETAPMHSDLSPRLQLRAEEPQLLKGPLRSLAKSTAHSPKGKSSRWPTRDVQNLLDTSSIFQPFWTCQILTPVTLYCSGLHCDLKLLNCKLLSLLALAL